MKDIIFELENRLLVVGIRSNANALSEILSPDFVEYGSSGKIYTYKIGDAFSDFSDKPIDYNISNFEVTELTSNTLLARYTIQINNENSFVSISNRSSIWQNIDGKWKVIFHQGTPVKSFSIENNKKYWETLHTLLKINKIVIDRPKGTKHPKYESIIYPLDYGYIDNTTSMDNNGIDLFIGGLAYDHVTGILCTFDSLKKDSEIKIMYKCSESDIQLIMDFFNNNYMNAIYIHNTF